MILSSHPGHKSDEVLPGLFFTAAPEDIEAIMADAVEPARYVVGYAGWSADQLEGELAEGAWLILPATREDLFSAPSGLWDRLFSRANLMKYMRAEDIPKNPELN